MDDLITQVRFNKAEFLREVEQVEMTHLLKYDYIISHSGSVAKYVREGEVFSNVEIGIRSLRRHQQSIYYEIPIKAPCSGYLFYDESGSYRGFRNCEDGELIASIYSDKNMVADLFKNKARVVTDEFTGASEMEWLMVCGSSSNKAFKFKRGWYEGFHIALTLVNNRPCIRVIYETGTEKYRKGDIFEILLSNDSVLTFVLMDNPVRIVGSKNYKFHCVIDETMIEVLKNGDVLKIRLRKKDGNGYILGDNSSTVDQTISQIVFRKYVEAYKKALLDGDFKWDTDEESSATDPCYVYLMVDTANGYHKIGISNRPEYRERTLQSEKPTIEKVCAKQYPSRIIAEAIEAALHKAFDSKRIRGEWFDLTERDIEDIKATLS